MPVFFLDPGDSSKTAPAQGLTKSSDRRCTNKSTSWSHGSREPSTTSPLLGLRPSRYKPSRDHTSSAKESLAGRFGRTPAAHPSFRLKPRTSSRYFLLWMMRLYTFSAISMIHGYHTTTNTGHQTGHKGQKGKERQCERPCASVHV